MQSGITDRSKCLPLNIHVSASVTVVTVAETMKQKICDGIIRSGATFAGSTTPLQAIAARRPSGLRQASPATCRASVARYLQPCEKRSVRGEPTGYELREEPDALRLACLPVGEKPE